MKKLLRKIGVGILGITMGCMVAIMVSSTVLAGTSGLENATPEELRMFRDSGVIGTVPSYPSNENALGGCNSSGTFCWSFTLPGAPTPPYQYYPIEVYGHEARVIVQRGYIVDKKFSWNGWRYLVKTGWQHWFKYKNKTFDCSVSNYTPKDYYCQEWAPDSRWK